MKPKLKLLLNYFPNYAHKFAIFLYYNLAEKTSWQSRKGTEFIGTIQLWFLIDLHPLRKFVNLQSKYQPFQPAQPLINHSLSCEHVLMDQRQRVQMKGKQSKSENKSKWSILKKSVLYIHGCTCSSFGYINIHFPWEKWKCLRGYA